MATINIPESLTNCIADSQVEVISWSADSRELVLRITKEIGSEIGNLRLIGVGYVHLPPRFELVGIAAFDGPFHDYPHLELNTGEFAFAFQGSDNWVHLVIAESVNYVILE
jgi:hypothetical protein